MKGSERMMWEKGSSGKAGEDLRWLRIKEGTGKRGDVRESKKREEGRGERIWEGEARVGGGESREPGWRGGANGEIRDDRIKAIKEGSRKKGSDD